MMEQAIINLCVNARDAMPEGGHLSIETENVLLDQDYCMQNIWATPGRYVLISVTDTGMGMTDDTLDHIFEPFFTTKKEGEGTGLGLATVYGAVRQQDGMVRVYSEIDKGTTFKIYLPVVERTADAVGTKIRTLPKSGTETILVAEDDTSLGNLAKLMLERDGYTVILASNGKEAVERYAEQPDKIDLLLLDVVMPIMGGREAFDRIREMDPDVPILFASGYSQNAIHTNFVIQTDKKILHKPYSANELRRALRDALD
jgi:two-component system cell cycle sensor histidine kinase/response regulator CckA